MRVLALLVYVTFATATPGNAGDEWVENFEHIPSKSLLPSTDQALTMLQRNRARQQRLREQLKTAAGQYAIPSMKTVFAEKSARTQRNPPQSLRLAQMQQHAKLTKKSTEANSGRKQTESKTWPSTGFSSVNARTGFTPLKQVTTALTGGYNKLGIGGVLHVRNYFTSSLYDNSAKYPNYNALVCDNYNWLTAENGCKWRYTKSDANAKELKANAKEYARCDEALAFAEQCGQTFRGHALVWGSEGSNVNAMQLTNKAFGCEAVGAVQRTECSDWSAQELESIIVEHITEHMTRYRGRVHVYDVVNEAVCDCVSWDNSKFATCEEYVATESGARKCGYSKRYGTYLKINVFWPIVDDYIGLSFRTAHLVDKDAVLGYNEYKFESTAGYGKQGGFLAEKGRCVYSLIQSLLKAGDPVHYVGSQTHIELNYLTEYTADSTVYSHGDNTLDYLDAVKDYSRRVVALGVAWHFTEVTVGLQDPVADGYMSTQQQSQQAALYSGLVEACLELGVESCPVFQTWGVADRYTGAYENKAAFMFDMDDNVKQSYSAVVATLKGWNKTARRAARTRAAAAARVKAAALAKKERADKKVAKGKADSCIPKLSKCSDNDACCNSDACYAKHEYYSQCRATCGGSDWTCAVDNWKPCDTKYPYCSGDRYVCYKRDDNYAQCRMACPTSGDWDCTDLTPSSAKKRKPTKGGGKGVEKTTG